MKVLLAPNAFKESMSAQAVAEAMAKGIRRVILSARIVQFPIADGGDGTLDVLVKLTHGKLLTRTITNPLGTRSIGDKRDSSHGLQGAVFLAYRTVFPQNRPV